MNAQAQPTAKPAARRNAESPLRLAQTASFKIRTPQEAEELSAFLAQAWNDPQRVQPGLLALMENAIEHGCLGIGHALKRELADNGTWQAERQRRLSLPENRQKKIDVAITRRAEGLFAVITDPGAGFAWKDWIHLDAARADAPVGRGIAYARHVAFDGLSYNPAGNQAVAFSKDMPEISW